MAKDKSSKEMTEIAEDLLKERSTDLLGSAVKVAAGSLPIIGGPLGELMDYAIPNQWKDRVCEFLEIVAIRIDALENPTQEKFLENQRSPEGLDLSQESILQAGNSFTKTRREYIANLLKNSLTKDEINHDQKKKLFYLLSQLNDHEIIYLKYYSMSIGADESQPFIIKHRSVLKSIRDQQAGKKVESSAEAFRDGYIANLDNLGLVQMEAAQITNRTPIGLKPLGTLLINYLEVPDGTE